MKKNIIITCSVAVLLALPQLGLAEEKAGKGEPAVSGKVTAVAAGTVTIAGKKGDRTFTTDERTTYGKSDKSAATAEDVKVGTPVRVTPGASPDQAAKVTVMLPKKKDSAKGAADSGKAKAPEEAPQATP